MAKKESYGKAIRAAYDQGFRAGWAAHSELPNRVGARTAAKAGFSKGLREHKRSDKYTERSKK